MKKLLTTIIALVSAYALATELQLVWLQPPGYQSMLYSSTNLAGVWTPLGDVVPPFNVDTTNQVSFFYVAVAPTNHVNSPVIFTNHPSLEGLRPQYTNAPAIAYDEDGFFGFYGWSIKEQDWR